jgi:hypothetical protein
MTAGTSNLTSDLTILALNGTCTSCAENDKQEDVKFNLMRWPKELAGYLTSVNRGQVRCGKWRLPPWI